MRSPSKIFPKPIFFLGEAEKENEINSKGVALWVPLSIITQNTFDSENATLKTRTKKDTPNEKI